MIRKAIIVVLTLATVGIGVVWMMSYSRNTRFSRFWHVQEDLDPNYSIGRAPFAPEYYRKDLWGGFAVYDGKITIQASLRDTGINVWIEPVSYAGFEIVARCGARAQRFEMTVPLWMPFIFFATYPTIAFIRRPLRRWRRHRKGLCVKCRYDLTGKESGVCPECGEAK